ncbi:guanine nucleotide-binding protein G(I)/G(S)/G(O) subunit gamma-7-like [Mizuhopecten yessoensis]|uniref:Guanine nucleotide-binding protein subunit gamma n=1 Tax=Mizuhopecten yessoensis TaxID=6573 RepID=A0A210QZI0_MIZYE|nr:guanine nucleotide-binding protein G(I)/G(S)/G(O) subunit gamma-7-like [Mizuhopecten yessoensis]OWF54179.1 Guanine nucleotide-binding protein G(I)/G(S)/G(O) subunit gamma-12 [Mizuhopecten yessoensis]
MSSQVQSLQKQLGQLRLEANVQRIPVSQAIEEIMDYTSNHAVEDGLVNGVLQSANPFRDQKSCIIV